MSLSRVWGVRRGREGLSEADEDRSNNRVGVGSSDPVFPPTSDQGDESETVGRRRKSSGGALVDRPFLRGECVSLGFRDD